MAGNSNTHILNELFEELPKPESAETIGDYLCQYMTTDSGEYSFAGHENLRAPLEDESKKVVILKGAQLGISTGFIGRALWHSDVRHHNVIYFMPSDELAKSFSSTKVDTAIQANSYLRAIISEQQMSRKKKDTVQLKKVRDKFLMILGLNSISNAISLSAEVLFFDEVDDLNEQHRIFAEDRIKHSKYRRQIFMGVGRIPGDGIDLEYENSDQKKLHYTCPHCGEADQILEELFLIEREEDGLPCCIWKDDEGSYYTGCVACGNELDRDKDGEWKATNPKKEVSGYRISALGLGFTDINLLMEEYFKAKRQTVKRWHLFKCSVLGIPDAGLGQVITNEVLNKAQTLIIPKPEAPFSFFGCDRGHICHVIIGRPDQNVRWNILNFLEVPEDELLPALQDLRRFYQFRLGVIDQAPGITAALQVADKLGRNRIWMCGFVGGSDISLDNEWDPTQTGRKKYRHIKCNREEAIGDYVQRWKDGHIFWPKTDSLSKAARQVEQDFRSHHLQLRKVLPKGVTNLKFAKYRDKCDNHFGMAGVYMNLAHKIFNNRRFFSTGAMPQSFDVRQSLGN